MGRLVVDMSLADEVRCFKRIADRAPVRIALGETILGAKAREPHRDLNGWRPLLIVEYVSPATAGAVVNTYLAETAPECPRDDRGQLYGSRGNSAKGYSEGDAPQCDQLRLGKQVSGRELRLPLAMWRENGPAGPQVPWAAILQILQISKQGTEFLFPLGGMRSPAVPRGTTS